MAGRTKYKSSSMERQVIGYPEPRVFMMFEAERTMMMRGKSSHVTNIITKHYESLAPSHQRQLLDFYDKEIKGKR